MPNNTASEAARELGRKRWEGVPQSERVKFAKNIAAKGAGRPAIMRACPKCGREFSVTQMRAHKC